MNVVDILILAILLIYILKGFKNGVIKEVVSFVGGILVLVLAFSLKTPLSVFLYEHLPFIDFGGIFSGISVINIIIYELLSFLILASVLMILFKILLGITNIIEKILKITVILAIPSKILGAIVGFLEGVIVVFIMLYIGIHIGVTKEYIESSKYGNLVLSKTPILSNVVEPLYDATIEIYEVANSYTDSEDKDKANLEALDILLKYELLDVENADLLVRKGKLNISNIENVLIKYKEG